MLPESSNDILAFILIEREIDFSEIYRGIYLDYEDAVKARSFCKAQRMVSKFKIQPVLVREEEVGDDYGRYNWC